MSSEAFADEPLTPSAVARSRGIDEILHYTSHKGVLGILASGAVKSRQRLDTDDYLEHIFHATCAVRKDIREFDYVNLSISRINNALFEIASEVWERNRDLGWAVLSFEPAILDHPGVLFSTTNNMYPAKRHGTGVDGLEALFAPRVAGRYGSIMVRGDDLPDNRPTDPQAEVLYPGELSTGFLQRIYVSDHTQRATILAQCDAIGHAEPDVIIDLDAFR